MSTKNIVIFASGQGTNAENIINYFKTSGTANVVLVISNSPDAAVIQRATKAGIQSLVINRKDFFESDKIVEHLKSINTDLIVLAGFLWMIPVNLISAFPNKIVNIHPALLPEFGGKGMYGMKVHEAVAAAGASKSGITIHFVNEHYDEGEIIAQFTCDVLKTDTPALLAKKIHELEQQFFPKVIEELILS